MLNGVVTAETIMRRDLTAVQVDDTVESAMHVLHSHSLSGVPVVDDMWHIKGFLSEFDVLRSALPSYMEILGQDAFLYGEHRILERKFEEVRNARVSGFMQPECRTVQMSTSVMSIADIMLRLQVKRLPVVDGDLLVGVIDRSDLCEYLLTSGERHEG